jgi:Ala-tRNA(Pro) deacylase
MMTVEYKEATTMAICAILDDFLQRQQISHRELRHPVAFTGQQLARALKVSETVAVKSVLLKANNGHYVMALLPAAFRIDRLRLRQVIGAKKLRLASEEALQTLFPKCEVGAMCPFSALCSLSLPVYADRALDENAMVIVHAGQHTTALQMAYTDVLRLLQPTIASFGVPVADAP